MFACDMFNCCNYIRHEFKKNPTTFPQVVRSFCATKHHAYCARFQMYRHYGAENVPRALEPSDYDSALFLMNGLLAGTE